MEVGAAVIAWSEIALLHATVGSTITRSFDLLIAYCPFKVFPLIQNRFKTRPEMVSEDLW
jgi:hypothetical protein